MIVWVPFPFIRYTIILCSGILTAMYFSQLFPLDGLQTGVYVLIGLYFLNFTIHRILKIYILSPGVLTLTILWAMGFLLVLRKDPEHHPNHLVHVQAGITAYQGVFVQPAEEKKQSWQQELQIVQCLLDGNWKKAQGKILVLYPKKGIEKPYQYGDIVLVKGQPHPVPGPSNPHGFDYRQYLSIQDIHHLHYVQKGEMQWLGNDPPSTLFSTAYALKAHFRKTLEEQVKSPDERAIALGLLLGIQDSLDPELRQAYADSGTLHILAVSGLHVGILYALIGFLFMPLRKNRHGKWAFAITSIALLWAYAFLTGLSPSALRAVTMFSLITVAKTTQQGSNIYNTLAVSAFFILLANPLLITSVGFQLSYAAVLGIAYLYPRIWALFDFNSPWAEWIWQMASLSIAAQLATMPLGFMYFHQFPVYFIPANLLLVPASFLALTLGIALLAFQGISYIGIGLGYLFNALVYAMDQCVYFIASLPYSTIQEVYLSPAQCIALYFSMTCWILLWQWKKFRFALLGTLSVLAFSSLQWIHFYQEVSHNRIVFYPIERHMAIDFIYKGIVYFYGDSVPPLPYRIHIQPNRIYYQSIQEKAFPPQALTSLPIGKLLWWENKKILVLDSPPKPFLKPLNVDYVVISGNALKNIHQLPPTLNFDTLILDASTRPYLEKRLMEQAQALHIPVIPLRKYGALNIPVKDECPSKGQNSYSQ